MGKGKLKLIYGLNLCRQITSLLLMSRFYLMNKHDFITFYQGTSHRNVESARKQ